MSIHRPDKDPKHLEFLARVGARLALRRRQLGMSQGQVAVQADIIEQHYWRIENGRCSVNSYTLYRITQVLGLSLDLTVQPDQVWESNHLPASRRLQPVDVDAAERELLERRLARIQADLDANPLERAPNPGVHRGPRAA